MENLLYDGGSFMVFQAGDPENVTIRFTDAITAFSGIKKAVIKGKGKLNAAIASMVAGYLEDKGIYSHFIERSGEDGILCRKVEMIPLEVIVRNAIAGTMARKLGVQEGFRPENTIFDLCYKNEDLGTPLINDHYAVALGLVSYDELKVMYDYAGRTNDFLTSLMKGAGIELVDFKLEFGRDSEGRIILADELTPDNARFRDMVSRERLDRDRFRYDMGRVGEAYKIIYERLCTVLERNDADEQR